MRREDCDPRGQEFRAQLLREGNRFRLIAVQANCLRPDSNIAAINCAHPILAQHPQNALGRFVRIVQQRVRP